MRIEDPTPEPAPAPGERYLLCLYAAGVTPRSVAAIQTVQHLCAVQLPGRYTLEVSDVHQQPALARAAGIVATPTLVKQAPVPVRRLIGGFSQVSRMLSASAAW
jgi:circadian clock protein KaiB